MEARKETLRFPAIARPAVNVSLWEERGRPLEADLRARLSQEGYQVVKWASAPYQGYLPHAHIYNEIMWVIAGNLTFILVAEGRLLELNAGDRIEVPAGTMHASQAGPEGAQYLLATR